MKKNERVEFKLSIAEKKLLDRKVQEAKLDRAEYIRRKLFDESISSGSDKQSNEEIEKLLIQLIKLVSDSSILTRLIANENHPKLLEESKRLSNEWFKKKGFKSE